MALFGKQWANVVNWEEYRDDQIFYKWNNDEIKKGSKLILRPGQNAIFLYQGKLEGVFKDPGDYDIASEIIPFLSTLKGIKFGFNSGIRAEVLFINTKEFTIKWGTKQPINLPTPMMPGGMPIRANGTLNFKLSDYMACINNIAGVKKTYGVEDIRIRITGILDQLLMKWISKEGKDMFNLQANADEIGRGIMDDLDMKLIDTGITIQDFIIGSVTYPEEIQNMITENASYSMVGDMDRYQRMKILQQNGGGGAAASAGNMMGAMLGMQMAQQMMQPPPPQYMQPPPPQYMQPNQGQYAPPPQQSYAQQPYGQQPAQQYTQPQYTQPPVQQAPPTPQPAPRQQAQPQRQQSQPQRHQPQPQRQQPQPQKPKSQTQQKPPVTQKQTSPPAKAGNAKVCPKCGTPTGGMKFCMNCGNKLG